MDTWKTSCGTLCHIVASGSAAAGQFTLDVLEICRVLSPECEEGHTWDPCLGHTWKSAVCYRPNVRKVTPGIHALHHLVNHNSQHIKTHILGPLAIIGGIPVLRG